MTIFCTLNIHKHTPLWCEMEGLTQLLTHTHIPNPFRTALILFAKNRETIFWENHRQLHKIITSGKLT